LHNRINRVLGGVVDHPWLTLVLVIGITGLALVGYIDPDLLLRHLPSGTSEQTAATETSEVPASRPAPDVEPLRLSDVDTILVIDSDQFFTVDGVAAVRQIVQRLEALPQVAEVMWLDRVPILNVFGLPEPLLPRGTATPSQIAAAKQKSLDHPLVVGQFLSPDAKTMTLMVSIDWLMVRDDDDVTTRLADTARDVIDTYPTFDATVGITGWVPLVLASRRSQEENQLRYQLIGYAVIALAALVLFRGPAAVFVVALAPALGVFWTLGILRFFQLEDNPFNDVILPTLLSLVGLTDGVHVMVQIRHYRAAGMSPRDAARVGTSEVGMACLLTSVTTAIGFGSLGLAGHEIVREFGWCCVIGVSLTLIAILTVIPLACRTILGRSIHVGHDSGIVQKRLMKIGVIIDRVVLYRRPVSWVAIGSTLLLALVCTQLQPDERRERGLPEGSPAVRSMRHMDEAFGGLETGSVVVRWSPDIAEDDQRVLDVLRETQEALQQQTLIGHPLSLVDLIATLPGNGSGGNRMAMAELLPAPLKRAFYQPESRTATIVFRVQDLGIARYAPVFEQLEDQFKKIAAEHPGFEIELTGGAVRRWQNLYRIVVDLATSLGAASLIIFVVLGIVYRSLRIGLISIIPNMFPLVLTGAGLVLFDQGLEMVSVCAFTVCLGIAVDDTIHFITRYLECRDESENNEMAIHRAFVGVGTALITTTLVLVAGFGTVLFSDSREHLIFASMGIATFLSALFADLVFLPALLSHFGPGAKNAGGKVATFRDPAAKDPSGMNTRGMNATVNAASAKNSAAPANPPSTPI
jgi:predicted RND superfamily exporter protein